MFILYPFFNNDWTLTAILLFKEKAKISNYNMLRAYYQNNQSVHKNRSIGKLAKPPPFHGGIVGSSPAASSNRGYALCGGIADENRCNTTGNGCDHQWWNWLLLNRILLRGNPRDLIRVGMQVAQSGQTVNLLQFCFVGSNPTLPMSLTDEIN